MTWLSPTSHAQQYSVTRCMGQTQNQEKNTCFNLKNIVSIIYESCLHFWVLRTSNHRKSLRSVLCKTSSNTGKYLALVQEMTKNPMTLSPQQKVKAFFSLKLTFELMQLHSLLFCMKADERCQIIWNKVIGTHMRIVKLPHFPKWATKGEAEQEGEKGSPLILGIAVISSTKTNQC